MADDFYLLAAVILPIQLYSLWWLWRECRRSDARLKRARQEWVKQDARFRELERQAGL